MSSLFILFEMFRKQAGKRRDGTAGKGGGLSGEPGSILRRKDTGMMKLRRVLLILALLILLLLLCAFF